MMKTLLRGDTSVDQDITLTDAVGNVSEVISISTLQPGGANAPPAEGAAPPPTPSEGGSVVASRGS